MSLDRQWEELVMKYVPPGQTKNLLVSPPGQTKNLLVSYSTKPLGLF